MKAFKVHNVEKSKQEVNLPAGTYTYSFRVIPVGTSYTFKLDNQSFTFEGLTAGVLNKRMKHTFELTEAVSFFYLSNTIGDCVYEPQIEEGVFATTPGAHPLDFERLISEAGIEIDHEALSLYAKKADVSAEIKITADRIDSTVGNISNDVDGVKGDMTTISQTVNSISATVTNHTTQISTFQQTVDQIYASIEDVGSGEFSYILQRIDEIEIKVGTPGQSGSIQVALDSIASTVYDENTGMSAINQKVGSITATVTNHTSQIATFQQTVDQIYLAIEDVGSGEFASITTRLDGIELKVYDENEGMSAIVQKVNSISSTVYDKHDTLLSQISQDGSNILIQASKIKLEGLVTANNNFKILADGSIEAKNGKFTGNITSNSEGEKVVISAESRSLKLMNASNEDVVSLTFGDKSGSIVFHQVSGSSNYAVLRTSIFGLIKYNTLGQRIREVAITPEYINISSTAESNKFEVDVANSRLLLTMRNLPTSSASLNSSQLYRDGNGFLRIK